MRVLVVHKLSAWSQRTEREQQLLDASDPTVARMKRAHDAHEECIRTTTKVLQDLGCTTTLVHDRIEQHVDGAELVVTVGGDGTLLHTSHYLDEDTPVLALNSAPNDSIGFFTAGSKDDAEPLLYKATRGDLPRSWVTRMEVQVGDTVMTTRALNDVLFCHTNPALMTRYFLQDGLKNEPEEQMSSGIWVSTAAGSTAAIRSAGGFTMPSDSDNIQFKVREPYQPRGRRLQFVHGFLRRREPLTITSKTEDGRVYVDGAHSGYPVTRGVKLQIQTSPEALCILSFRQR